MKKFKKALLYIILVIITFNYSYFKIAIYYNNFSWIQFGKLLAIELFSCGLILMLLIKKNHSSIYDKTIEKYFQNYNDNFGNRCERLLDCIDVGYAYYKVIKDEFGNGVNAKAIEVNQSILNILGIDEECMLECAFNTFVEKYINKKYKSIEIIDKVQNDGQFKISEYINTSKEKWILFSVHKIKKDAFALIITDVSARKKYIEEMNYLANYDALTELKNRYSIYNYLSDLKRKQMKFAILFIDLDNFKIFNDNFGHDLGDEVLHKVALNLKKHKSSSIEIGRLGGDEFIIILEDSISIDNIECIGQAVLDSLNFSFCHRAYTYNIKASIGVSVFDKDTDNITTLLKYADIAMYHSKNRGGNKISIFKGEMLENEIKKMY
ncbi:GGDEF domain-containing protein [Clostridium sp. SHJSY1]|uniref:GGDEF domain-containing protein n=1 Tax=Clostridium sp. SHJSY1 TaxID=2942483 RepID=UPI0028741AEA|nr:GGDEF domain-containing protein [Clostridium sp. SHJSY1]MDS0524398.1 GGDEF domain-containing protein [Clostridium sp. SHJSY1]